MQQTQSPKAGERTHEITCLAGIDSAAHECTCGNTAVTKRDAFVSSQAIGEKDGIEDSPKDMTAETVRSLLTHAKEDMRLAEITASRASYWHTAEDCQNIRIAIEKSLASMPI